MNYAHVCVLLDPKTMLAGSPGFQSPQQLKGESIGTPTDVYICLGSCGFVAFGETQVWPDLSINFTKILIMFQVTVGNKSQIRHLSLLQ